MNGQIIPEETEKSIEVKQENATFLVIGDKAYTSEIIEEYNRNAEAKTEDFNTNAENKTSSYNSNAADRTTAFNNNYNDKVTAFNSNANKQTEEFDAHVLMQTNTFNNNAASTIANYNSNAEQKTNEFNQNALSYQEGIDANKKHIINVSNELERVKNDVLETGTDTDTFVHLEDSAMAEYQELEVDGVCEQETTTGITKSNTTTYSTILNDLTISTDDDNIFTLNGTPTAAINKSLAEFIGKNYILPAGVYYCHIKYISGSMNYIEGNTSGGITINIRGGNNEQVINSNNNAITPSNYQNHQVKKFTLTNEEILDRVQIMTGTVLVFNNLKIRIWWSTKEDDNYEPYTGGQPSPNPDYPQEIKTIENSFKIRSNNFNYIFGIDIKETLVEKVALRSVNNGIINIKKTTTEKACNVATYVKPISVKAGDKINVEILKGTINGIFSCHIMDKNWNRLGTYNSSKEENLITSDGIVAVIMPYIPETTTFEDVDFVFALNVEESLETQIEVNLPEGEFAGYINDTYKDTLKVEYNEKDGQYHLNLYKGIGRELINKPATGRMDSNRTYPYFYFSGEPNLKATTFSAKLNYLSKAYNAADMANKENNNNTICWGSNSTFIRIDKFTTVEEYIEWLNSVDLILYAPLKAPYVIDLGVVDMPITYNEVTNLFTDSDLMPTINAKYYRNFITTIQNLQVNEKALKQELVDINTRLSALETAQASIAQESEVVE